MSNDNSTDRFLPCDELTWCSGHWSRSRGQGNHHGVLGQVSAGASEVTVQVSVPRELNALEFELQFDNWAVTGDQVDQECADLCSIANQARELMSAWGREHFPHLV